MKTYPITKQDERVHICQPGYCGLDGMRSFYDVLGILPTSTNADIILIRSHIAYWAGRKAAETAAIKASRGHSYRVAPWGRHSPQDVIVRISNHYDHRDGVEGYR